MAVAAVLAGGAFDLIRQLTGHSSSKNSFQQIKQEFQQLGADLQAGNLPQAQTDLDALQQNLPSAQQSSSITLQTSPQANAQTPQSTLAAAVSQLTQDLQSTNLSAAQSDFAALQQGVQQIGQQQGAAGAHHHHHHHSSSSGENPSSGQPQSVSSLFNQFGRSLQSGNLSAPQQAYITLQQDFQQFVQGNSPTTGSLLPAGSSGVNVSA